ncbi:MAG: DUF5658 family protein [Chloroflexota bacterium]|nr:DUF5658 family protein [Chloroflexota bacterium]
MAHVFEGAATFRRCPYQKLLFVSLAYLDLVLTLLAVSLGFTELNPLVRSLLPSLGAFLLLKGGVPLLIAWLVPGRLLLPSIALQSLVLFWNGKELFLSAL